MSIKIIGEIIRLSRSPSESRIYMMVMAHISEKDVSNLTLGRVQLTQGDKPSEEKK